jgi:hypothetical protein
MWLPSWLRYAPSTSPRARSRNRRRRAQRPHGASGMLQLEQLEDRTVLNATATGNAQLLQAYAQLPLSFEANQGQAAARSISCPETKATRCS